MNPRDSKEHQLGFSGKWTNRMDALRDSLNCSCTKRVGKSDICRKVQEKLQDVVYTQSEGRAPSPGTSVYSQDSPLAGQSPLQL